MKLVRFNQTEPYFPNTFSGMLDKFFNENMGTPIKHFNPAVDVSEDEKSYEIQLAVPGVKKSDFKVDLTEGKLTISGERKFEEKKEGKNYHSLETQYGSFSRSFYVPEDIHAEDIAAVYEDGVLKVTLPKKEKKVVKAAIEVK
ncbi:Hsp20/alpha crystallin family protein [Algoriphagus machipongonensis]|uniref:Heat shock protein, Hsp20 family n=1 Tax=Algoriphagus machipongonensis TaxID=388413 RepID=A3HWK2_9BACT|nr:Hsp20/alpha crystallin family protein [Algoriphagus machipongonensis]EAZ80975.1 heat shock protein, Hsp20 family [Algoriphagus machipongonensis]